jgi:hypothetical protein
MSIIDALLAEREGLLRRGLKDRVKQVDEQLASLGHHSTETATAEPKQERASRPAPKKRTTAG